MRRLRASSFLILTVYVATGFISSAPAQAETLKAYPNFIVSFWEPPPPAYATPARYQEIKAAGFNTVTDFQPKTLGDNLATLSLCRQAGLQGIINDSRMDNLISQIENLDTLPANYTQILDQIISDYASQPALAGYFVIDEPHGSWFPLLASINQYLLAHDPTHLPFFNLLPMDDADLGWAYAPPGQLTGTYVQYVSNFLSTVHPAVLFFDRYPLSYPSGEDPAYFQNLEVIRSHAKAANVPFGQYILSSQIVDSAGNPYTRQATSTDLSWQTFMLMSHGAQGIYYFTYWTWTQPGNMMPFGYGLINPNGAESPLYSAAQALNQRLQMLVPTLSTLSTQDVYYTGTPPAGTHGLTAQAPITQSTGNNLVIGWLTDASGHNYLMVTNLSTSLPANSSLTLAGQFVNVMEISQQSGQPQSASYVKATHTLSISLNAGDGKLFRLDTSGVILGAPGCTVAPTCSADGKTATVTWTPATGATVYTVWADDLASPWSGDCAHPNTGDACYNGVSSPYPIPTTAGHSFSVTVNASDGTTWQSATCPTFSCTPGGQGPATISGIKLAVYNLAFDNGNYDQNGLENGQSITLDGSVIAQNNGMAYGFQNVSPGVSHTVTTTVDPGWAASHVLCYNNPNCDTNPMHAIPGTSVTVNPSPGDQITLWWWYTPPTGTIQGSEVDASGAAVPNGFSTIIAGLSFMTATPYSASLPGGSYSVVSTVPDGYTASYSVCPACAFASGNFASVNVSAGQTNTVNWKYTTAPRTLASLGLFKIADPPATQRYTFGYAPAIIQQGNTTHAFFCSQVDGGGLAAIRYTFSTNGGNTWSTPTVAVPASGVGTSDLDACDPSVVYYQGTQDSQPYYYLFYSSVYNPGGGNLAEVQVARAAAISGPYATYGTDHLWHSQGTLFTPQIIVYPAQPHASNANYYGAGQQSVVATNGKLWMWYNDDTTTGPGSFQTYLMQSNNPVVWSTSTENAVTIGGALISNHSPDVKFDPVSSKFVMLAVRPGHAVNSDLERATSSDGINFSAYSTVIPSQQFPYFAHNVGFSGDVTGAMPAGQSLVGFGAPYDINQTASMTINFWDLYGVRIDLHPISTQPPVAQNLGPLSATAGTALPITLQATDPNSLALTYSIVTQPAHGTLSAVTGNQVTYTANPAYTGSDSFTYKANNGAADSNVATVSITVSAGTTTTTTTTSTTTTTTTSTTSSTTTTTSSTTTTTAPGADSCSVSCSSDGRTVTVEASATAGDNYDYVYWTNPYFDIPFFGPVGPSPTMTFSATPGNTYQVDVQWLTGTTPYDTKYCGMTTCPGATTTTTTTTTTTSTTTSTTSTTTSTTTTTTSTTTSTTSTTTSTTTTTTSTMSSTTTTTTSTTTTTTPPGTSQLPAPDLSGIDNRTYMLNDTISINYNSSATGFNWEFDSFSGPASIVQDQTMALTGSTSVLGTPIPTSAPRLSLANLSLLPGQYTVKVRAINGNQTSAWASARISLVSVDLSAARVYPNPWRAARGDGSIVFDQMPANSTVKIFTVSGRWVKTLSAPGGYVSWDLTNDSGEKVASGIYLYLITDGQGNKTRGKFVVIR